MDNDEKGWISIHRKLKDHWIWDKNRVFSEAEAWIDLLLYATHDDQDVKIGMTIYKVKRGQQIRSLKTLSKEWNWSISKVRRFLILLENENMIELKSDTQTTQITICKYDVYQQKRNANETQLKNKRNATEKQMKTDNNDNKDNNVNKSVGDQKYLDELPAKDRDNTIRQYLSTSTLTPSQINIYMKRLASNSYCKVISGNKHRIKLTEVRADAEYLQAMGWLDTKENANTQTISMYD